ncbi:MAG: gp436 family protein [Candidatus Binataceae bacterium]
MSYAQAQAIVDRYPARDLIQLTNEDPAATTANAEVIGRALDDASAEIDSYLEGRFRLPLTDPPAVLERLAIEIAMYRLQSLRPLHDLKDARQRYDDAIAMLRRVANGEISLGLSPAGSAAPRSAPDDVDEGQRRVFGRDKLRGF